MEILFRLFDSLKILCLGLGFGAPSYPVLWEANYYYWSQSVFDPRPRIPTIRQAVIGPRSIVRGAT